MKKKSPRGIPDFSRKPTQGKKGGAQTETQQPAHQPAPVPARQSAKPQATSSKSGHRGS